MAESQKIFVAKVNGDALSMGSSLVFAADIIVAQEDAKIADQTSTDPAAWFPAMALRACAAVYVTGKG